ncbi:DUF1844 domain-containing protein [Candidatus Sumerlaeota bacterium]|nr:DUF1844 domain-containing protein [Candidatus Sumerlaeota bacterium]
MAEEKEEKKEEEVKTEKKEEPASGEKKKERLYQLPPPSFPQLVETFFYQAMISLGKQMNPVTKKYERDLVIAQYHIGILELLQEKTKSNLSKDEEQHLEEILHTLRIAYIDEAGKEKKE